MNFFGFGSKKKETNEQNYTSAIPNSENEMYTLNTSKQPILNLLRSSKDEDKLKGLRVLAAMYFTRKEVSSFLPYIVNIISSNFLVKKLVYYFLVNLCEYGSEEILMSINSLHKELNESKPIICATALRALSSFRLEEIQPVISLSISKAVISFSIYVRRASAYALIKISPWEDPEKVLSCLHKLLTDASPLVIGPALLAFSRICPQRLDLLHPFYRRLCGQLDQLEPLFMGNAVYLLMSYARTYLDTRLINPSALPNPDLDLFLNQCEELLSIDSPSVVLAVAQVFFIFKEKEKYMKTVLSMLNFNSQPYHLSYLSLMMINEYAKEAPSLFRTYATFFALNSRDVRVINVLKLEILGRIAAESNIKFVLKELENYAKWESEEITILSIATIGKIAETQPNLAESCTKKLIALLKSQSPMVNAQIIIVLRKLIMQEPDKYRKVIVHCARIVETIQFPYAKASAVWIIGAYWSMIPTLAAETIRKLTLSFRNENTIVKHQILNTTLRVYIGVNEGLKEVVYACLKHLLNISFYDLSYDIRDKARLLSAIYITKEINVTSIDLFAEFENKAPVEIAQTGYLPLTVSFILRKKIAGYSKYWEFLNDVEGLASTLAHDTSTLRREQAAPVIRVPEATSYSNLDVPKIGDTGMAIRVAVDDPRGFEEFMNESGSSYEYEDEDEEEEAN